MKKKIFKSTISNLGTKRKREKFQNKSKKNNTNPNSNNIERRQSNNIRNNNNNNSNTNNDNIQINNINLKENKKRKGNKSNPRENYLLLNIFHSNPQYKRRKIRIGVNRQCIQEDELVEVTPHFMRIRKILLDPLARKRNSDNAD